MLWGEVHDPNAWAMGGVAGHAGLFATAADVMRFAQTRARRWHGRSDALPRAALRSSSASARSCRRDRLGARLGHADAGAVDLGPALLGALDRAHGFTGTSLWIDLEREAVVVMLTNRVHQVAKRSRFELRADGARPGDLRGVRCERVTRVE